MSLVQLAVCHVSPAMHLITSCCMMNRLDRLEVASPLTRWCDDGQDLGVLGKIG